MCNIVTERFISCLEKLKDSNEIKSIRQFALAVDYHPQNLNDIMKGKRDVTIELIKNAAEIYKINTQYIFTGLGSMFSDEEIVQHPSPAQQFKSLEKIVYVPTAAHAGYTEQFHDPVFLDDLVSFSLPDYKFQHGTYRCFDIMGDSMEPSLYAGDKVVCSQVDSNNFYSSVRNNLVYVIVMDGSLVVKRVLNKVRENRTMMMLSDNSYYQPYEVAIEEIREIWHVEVKISPYLPSPNNIRNAFHEEMDGMKKIIDQQSKSIQMLNHTVEKLLKQNRSVV
ncbi:MAG: LexA family transcriptional regulator [Saprospiraceae bacterium]|jgi:phage repressor protein C with HTH and peptisase S24 domain|nr:LexA family transcriptional regulator [Saprospiraceae bacterium]